jgi:hypothetical protein
MVTEYAQKEFKGLEPGETLSATAPIAGLIPGVASPTRHRDRNPELSPVQPLYAAERIDILLKILHGIDDEVRAGLRARSRPQLEVGRDENIAQRQDEKSMPAQRL